MQSYTTSTWGYKILPNQNINFYHVLLSKVELDSVKKEIPYLQYLSQQSDGSITISIHFPSYTSIVIQNLVTFLEKKASEFLDTPDYNYKITLHQRQLLKEWSFAFLGCLSFLLVKESSIKTFIKPEWELINSYIGSIYLSPYTMLLYEDYPKIIHPVTLRNYESRNTIEKITTGFIEEICKKLDQAQKGYEGIAILLLLEKKTGASAKEIAYLINKKTNNLKHPNHTPIFAL